MESFFDSVIMGILLFVCAAGAGALIMMAVNVIQVCYKNITEED